MPAQPVADPSRPPPIEFAVAVWLGMADDEIERGLREGWIRAPQGVVPPASDAPAPSPDASTPAGSAVDRARVEALVRRLDGSLDATAFEAAWNEAGADDASRAERFSRFLGDVLGVPDVDVSRFAMLEAAAGDAGGGARFVRLSGRSGSELDALARGDASVRRSLARHVPWALAGDRALAALADPDGRYDRFDRDSGEALLSDDWIADRAAHAAWREAASSERSLQVDGPGWRFVDRADATSGVELEGDGEAVHQVVFARDGGEHVSGGATTDRMHGGDGDDELLGRGGDDLLEGARGDDAILGGAGRDDLSGQQGDDELDGGAGSDRVHGGSGDDDISGGRGDDLLRGGAGRDRYRFDEGDGNDVIEDADGGEIVVDDIVLLGEMRHAGDGWSSADGRLSFSLQGSAEAGGTLSIRRTGGDAGDTLTIARWRQGAFGFALAQAGEVSAGDRDQQAYVSADPFGNEGSTGVVASDIAGADSEDAASAGEPIAASQVVDDGIAALVGGTDEAGTAWVDMASLAQAFDAWSVPAPPDVGAASLHDARAVTAIALADALAGDAVPFDDADAGALPVNVATMSLPMAGDVVGPLPPPIALRHAV